jgi:hypothetical protein
MTSSILNQIITKNTTDIENELNNPKQHFKLQEIVASNSVFKENCYSIDKNANIIYLFSPFILALTGIINSKLPSNDINARYQNSLIIYFNKLINNSEIMGHFSLNERYRDIDTIATILIFLKLQNINDENTNDNFNNILANKSKTNKGYYTWINRQNNNIDYFVNMNIYILFQMLRYYDKDLNDYLECHLANFIRLGSHYYEDIVFPVFLILFYFTENIIDTEDKRVRFILSEVLSDKCLNNKLLSILKQTKMMRNTDFSLLLKSHFNQYFNSSSKRYGSYMLDAFFNAYLSIPEKHDRISVAIREFSKI